LTAFEQARWQQCTSGNPGISVERHSRAGALLSGINLVRIAEGVAAPEFKG